MDAPGDDRRWLLLTYRVPSKSSRARVAVWRDLRRLGALYLQQAVCVLPDVDDVRESLSAIRAKIAELDGTSFFAVLTDLEPSERQQLVDGFIAGSEKDYAEIVEECETKFFKEIEFERFRQNYTFEETEEIGQDLEKLRRWLAKVIARDWMSAPGRALAEAKVAECAVLLEDFENDVYQRSGQGEETE
ncbi:Chromate resistance protein ChrB [Nakamurella lactea]|uniref:Chromate resistance protein ChrB n=1 Tax=Nakamurella lactea TaxID=459515 RepID=UPI000408284B|nr:Chromate resistance protein ChrB [Nakamurella lactea]